MAKLIFPISNHSLVLLAQGSNTWILRNIWAGFKGEKEVKDEPFWIRWGRLRGRRRGGPPGHVRRQIRNHTWFLRSCRPGGFPVDPEAWANDTFGLIFLNFFGSVDRLLLGRGMKMNSQ